MVIDAGWWPITFSILLHVLRNNMLPWFYICNQDISLRQERKSNFLKNCFKNKQKQNTLPLGTKFPPESYDC